MIQKEFDKIEDLRPLLCSGNRNYTSECLHYLGDYAQLSHAIRELKNKLKKPPHDVKVLLKYNGNWQIGSYVYHQVYKIYDKDNRIFQTITSEPLEWDFLPFETFQEFRELIEKIQNDK